MTLYEILTLPSADAVPAFLERWHGVRDVGPPLPGEPPGALEPIYRAVGSAPTLYLAHHLLPPAALEPTDGFCAFFVEEQGVWQWAVAEADLAESDPAVWCRESETGAEWARGEASLFDWLLHALAMSAALDAPAGAVAAWLKPSDAETALGPLHRLPFASWPWPAARDSRWYAGENALAWSCANVSSAEEPVEAVSVFVGAHTGEALRFLEPHIAHGWDHVAFRDG